MANQTVTGQYECQHRSGVGLDYFTSRIDRLILRADGRFTLSIQKQSRAAGAAQAWLKGEQAKASIPETQQEGSYTIQDRALALRFDNGGIEEAQISWDGAGIQIGPNFFTKVSDSTFLPPTHRLKQDMEDIAKGVQIATTLGGFAMKAAKTLQETIQPGQEKDPANPSAETAPASPSQTPVRQSAPGTPQTNQPPVIFCEQCGTRSQPGKRFCNRCGARLL